jgi:putative heme-binding domain-containing protein
MVLARCGNDPLIPHIVWQNLHPLLEGRGRQFVEAVQALEGKASPGLKQVVPRAIERMLAGSELDAERVASLLRYLVNFAETDPDPAARAVELITDKIQSGEVSGKRLESLQSAVGPIASQGSAGEHGGKLSAGFALLAACCNDARGLAVARALLRSPRAEVAIRLQALESLLYQQDRELLPIVSGLLTDRAANSAEFRGRLLGALGPLEDPHVAEIVLAAYAKLEPDVRPRAIELLTQRASWSKRLLEAIAAKQIPSSALNVNQVRGLLGRHDPEIDRLVKADWGTLRDGRNPQREQVVNHMRDLLRNTPGDPHAGQQVFKKLCAECHAIYGAGQDVGPDLTSNGRNDFDQLLSNVFDPSLVIGASYQAIIVATDDGRVLTGLLVEQNPERVVLKAQGGKIETIARSDVEDMKLASLSLMPEDLEKQLTRQEIADLFAFLVLDKPPSDPSARRLPGAPAPRSRAASEPSIFK